MTFAFAVTRHFVGIVSGKKAVRVCEVVCNAHLIPEDPVWAEKSPCCLATTLASNGLPSGRDPHLGSATPRSSVLPVHLVQLLYDTCKT